MNHATSAVTSLDPELVQAGDAVGQWAERCGLRPRRDTRAHRRRAMWEPMTSIPGAQADAHVGFAGVTES
jgi:hypothetical protein